MTAAAELPRAALDEPLGALFEREAARGPHRLAAKGRRHALTYGELDRAANRVARAILERTRREAPRLALLFAHDAPVVGAILGAFKAGACYVPVDPHHAADRQAAMLADCTPALLVCDRGHLGRAREIAPAGCEVLDADALDATAPAGPPRVAVSPRAPALICYSSGSTGEPKGIVWDQRGIVHRAMIHIALLGLTPVDRVALFQSVAVGASLRRIFGALLSGGAVMPFDIRSESADALTAWLAAERITSALFAASVFRHFAGRLTGSERFPALRNVWLASEPVRRSDVELFRARFGPSCELMTGFSTSECGSVSEFRVHDGAVLDGAAVPIGTPVADKQVLLLDDAGQEVAPGEIGEIAVRSEFLALGYWGRPDLDARIFLDDPAGGAARICRTGDLGRMRPDGCLLHLGRKDARAKLRGRFVDTGEIENALMDHPGLAGAVVTVREDRPGDQRLVAHVVARRAPPPPVDEVQRFVRERIGVHLVPSAVVFLDALPRTANGKVNRAALPAPGRSRPALARPFAAPHTPVEAEIARIWCGALDLDEVGIQDEFLELGGTSLVAGRITAAVVARFGVSLSVPSLLDARTVEAMAAAVVVGLLETVPPDAATPLDAIGPADLR